MTLITQLEKEVYRPSGVTAANHELVTLAVELVMLLRGRLQLQWAHCKKKKKCIHLRASAEKKKCIDLRAPLLITSGDAAYLVLQSIKLQGA